MTAPAAAFGPWAPELEPAERLARLRSLRALARVCLGPRGQQLADALRQAETDETALPMALDALDALAPVDRRRVLASFAALSRPAA